MERATLREAARTPLIKNLEFKIGLLLALTVLLAVGLVSIFRALGGNVQLPNQGSLNAILNEQASTATPAASAGPGPRTYALPERAASAVESCAFRSARSA